MAKTSHFGVFFVLRNVLKKYGHTITRISVIFGKKCIVLSIEMLEVLNGDDQHFKKFYHQVNLDRLSKVVFKARAINQDEFIYFFLRWFLVSISTDEKKMLCGRCGVITLFLHSFSSLVTPVFSICITESLENSLRSYGLEISFKSPIFK